MSPGATTSDPWAHLALALALPGGGAATLAQWARFLEPAVEAGLRRRSVRRLPSGDAVEVTLWGTPDGLAVPDLLSGWRHDDAEARVFQEIWGRAQVATASTVAAVGVWQGSDAGGILRGWSLAGELGLGLVRAAWPWEPPIDLERLTHLQRTEGTDAAVVRGTFPLGDRPAAPVWARLHAGGPPLDPGPLQRLWDHLEEPALVVERGPDGQVLGIGIVGRPTTEEACVLPLAAVGAGAEHDRALARFQGTLDVEAPTRIGLWRRPDGTVPVLRYDDA